ncbi:hypothetical protein N0V91_010907 [Didymella pomorum]|uniref:GPI anchored protein n=1 Tax=Didymella pomorum TaxID=749634 RepID=A0A9W9D032_9PLEO|nr:hypothetical protein N0V91_010907 [Didymella pomorum]
MRQSLAVLSFVACAAALDIQFVFPGGIEGPSPVATIESVEGSTTSALVGCPTGTSIEDCGLGPGLNVEIIGGTRYDASMSVGTVSVSYGCDGYDSAANTMTCTAAMAGQDTQTAVLSGSDVAFISASVIEGASLLGGGASETASASASSSASASATASAASKTSAAAASSGMQTSMVSGTAAVGSHASSHAASATGSSAPQSTGAAARFGIEGAALLALAGAAAVNVL